MPNTTAAKKALRQSLKRQARNTSKKRTIKEVRKEISKALAANTKPTQELMNTLYKAVDKAAKSNTIHPNKAARLKSRLQKKANAGNSNV